MCSSFIIPHALLSHVSLFCVLPFLCQRYTHTHSFTVYSHWHIQVQTHAGPSGIQRKSAHTEDCKHTLLCFGGSVLVKEDSDDFAKGSEDSRAEVGG